MNVDNILAITLIPLVGFWSDHVWTRIGRQCRSLFRPCPWEPSCLPWFPWIPLWLGSSNRPL